MADNHNPCAEVVCKEFPQLERLNYCHGQMLGAQDFVDEQNYFQNKIALLTRCLQGYGVVCGLVVSSDPKPRAASDSKYEAPNDYTFIVSCGLAVDPRGRELVVNSPVKRCLKELLAELDPHLFEQAKSKKQFSLYLTIEYRAIPTGSQALPSRGCCGDVQQTIHNRWTEQPCVRLTFDCPPEQTCDSCCQTIESSRVWLAELTFCYERELILDCVDNTIRRPIATYQTTKVSGTNWLHTGVYEECLAEFLLNNGLVIEFSSPIDEQSIKNHEVQIEGNKYPTNDLVEVALSDELDINKNNPLHVLQARIETIPSDDKKVRKIRVKVETRNLAPPLRILITIRTEFILDACCQPVDGSNRGGVTRYLGLQHGNLVHPADVLARTEEEHSKRYHPPLLCQDWNVVHRPESGNGSRGSNFQSWLYVIADKKSSYVSNA